MKIYFLTIRRLEAQDVHSFDFFCGLFSWCSDGHFHAVSSHEFSVHKCPEVFSPYKKASDIRLGPILMASL